VPTSMAMAILAQIADVLVDEGERRIGGPFRDHIRLGNSVLGGGRDRAAVLGIRATRRSGGKLRAQAKGEAAESAGVFTASRALSLAGLLGPPMRADMQHGS